MGSQEPTSRREFLRGRSAVRALLGKTRELADSTAAAWGQHDTGGLAQSRRDLQAGARICVSRRAMACEFSIEYHVADGPAVTDDALAALDRIEQVEAQLTVYRDHSEVVQLNRSAHTVPFRCGPGLFDLLVLAEKIAHETGGALDITTGPLSKAWGFFRREGRLPTEADLQAAMARVGYQHVVLDRDAQTVQLGLPGVEIQFNSIGKGYALDQAAQLLAQTGLLDFLIQGGSSSILARGIQRDGVPEGWRVGVPHPLDPDRNLGEICLTNRCLGTAGSATQFFEAGGRRYGHLLDPRTGWPVDGVLTASAVADSAAEADALATAFFVMGQVDTAHYCAKHPDHGALLVCPGKGRDTIDIHSFNLTPEQWRPA